MCGVELSDQNSGSQMPKRRRFGDDDDPVGGNGVQEAMCYVCGVFYYPREWHSCPVDREGRQWLTYNICSWECAARHSLDHSSPEDHAWRMALIEQQASRPVEPRPPVGPLNAQPAGAPSPERAEDPEARVVLGDGSTVTAAAAAAIRVAPLSGITAPPPPRLPDDIDDADMRDDDDDAT